VALVKDHEQGSNRPGQSGLLVNIILHALLGEQEIDGDQVALRAAHLLATVDDELSARVFVRLCPPVTAR
jgi:hypothetical protein